MRVAFLTPLPPAPTGIAAYSRAVLDRLERRGVGHELVPRAPRSLEEAERLAETSDLAVYHVGNNPLFHRHIYGAAIRRPGLVVLHDLALDDLIRGLDAASDPAAGPARTEARAAARALRTSGLDVDPPLATPWSAHLVRRARGVIVHAPFGARYLEAFGCRTPVFVVPHPPVPEPSGSRAARAERRVRRRLAGRSPVVGVLGDIGGAKGIEAVLDAVARLEQPALLAIVGRRIPGFDAAEAVGRSGLGDRVVVEQDVSDVVFGAWLRACDVVVNLRHPHRGEVSGTLVRAMQAGVPTVVSATGTYLDLPDDAVVRVPAGPPDPQALVEALGVLLADPARRRAIGERAR
ncbi:MAG TPA: glycosyltransferase family 4 protein, partial [Actinomycetota bacterium]